MARMGHPAMLLREFTRGSELDPATFKRLAMALDRAQRRGWGPSDILRALDAAPTPVGSERWSSALERAIAAAKALPPSHMAVMVSHAHHVRSAAPDPECPRCGPR